MQSRKQQLRLPFPKISYQRSHDKKDKVVDSKSEEFYRDYKDYYASVTDCTSCSGCKTVALDVAGG